MCRHELIYFSYFWSLSGLFWTTFLFLPSLSSENMPNNTCMPFFLLLSNFSFCFVVFFLTIFLQCKKQCKPLPPFQALLLKMLFGSGPWFLMHIWLVGEWFCFSCNSAVFLHRTSAPLLERPVNFWTLKGEACAFRVSGG